MDRRTPVLATKLAKALTCQGLPGKWDRVLVALSGGGDSVALLRALLEWGGERGLEVAAAHVNHGLRGRESLRDEEFVRQLCGQLGVPLDVVRVDTRAEMEAGGENLEACARRLRYAFLFERALERDSIVATGHTLNDQVETFLMKLARGAGTRGLSGISPLRVNRVPGSEGDRRITVIRPLLGVTKEEVLEYLEGCRQDYRRDRSNRDLGRDRNWVRHQLIPLLEERLNPNLSATLERTIQLMRETNERLEREGRRAFEACNLAASPGELRLSISHLQGLDPALQRQLIRLALAEAKGDLRDIVSSHVEGVRRLLASSSGKRLHLPDGLRVDHEFGDLLFTRAPLPEPFCKPLPVPGEVFIDQLGKTVRAAKLTGRWDPATVAVHFSGDRLTVRSRRPGDRYRTDPDSTERKLKELFQKRRVLRSQRDRLVLIEGGDQILWVEGFPPPYRLDPSVRVTEAMQLVKIEVRPETSSA